MFKAKITLSFLILLIFLIVTSIIKNQTRGLEKKIIQLEDFKKNILKLSHGKKKHYLVKII